MLQRTQLPALVVALLLSLVAVPPAPASAFRAALPTLLRGSTPAPAFARALRRGRPRTAAAAAVCAALDLFEKDCVEFEMPPDMQAQYAPKTLALGAVVDADALLLQPLCVREEGSTEWYPDSRAEAITVQEDSIVRIMDTYPSQRPIPSLGGGIGYGAEAVDCWEMQEALDPNCAIPLEDTGMGFHQKGW